MCEALQTRTEEGAIEDHGSCFATWRKESLGEVPVATSALGKVRRKSRGFFMLIGGPWQPHHSKGGEGWPTEA